MNIFILLSTIFLPLGALLLIAGIVLTIVFDEPLYLLVLGMIGTLFLIAGTVLCIVYASLKKKKAAARELTKTGTRVVGQIQRVYMTSVVYHYGAKTVYPYYIDCLARNPITGEQRVYTSDALFYNPSGFLKDTELPVYFDAAGKHYHVDTSSIIPEEAFLHKFKTAHFNRKLKKTGIKLTTEVIGTELVGTIAFGGGAFPLKVSKKQKSLDNIELPIDEYGYTHIGYSILSSYTDEKGQLHIFGSKEFVGKPKMDYTGEVVDVYVDNKYQKYYVDYEKLGLE